MIGALSAAIVLLLVLQRQRLTSLVPTLEAGATSSVLPLLNTASQVGFGAVIASLAGFTLIRDAVLGIAPGNPLGDTWPAMGQAAGIAPDLLHRVTAIATGGLDALPHNGAVITLLGICGLSHRKSYFDIFMVAVAFPLVALVAVVTLGTVFGNF